MIHARFDLDQALKSAQNAVKLTGTARYVIREAIGLRIENKRPSKGFYEAYVIRKSGVRKLKQRGLYA